LSKSLNECQNIQTTKHDQHLIKFLKKDHLVTCPKRSSSIDKIQTD